MYNVCILTTIGKGRYPFFRAVDNGAPNLILKTYRTQCLKVWNIKLYTMIVLYCMPALQI